MANYGDLSLDQAILQLILQHEVPDQACLLRLLAEDGFKLTQGTLSRRLAKLNVEKRRGRYQRIIPIADDLIAGRFLIDAGHAVIGSQLAEDLGLGIGDKLRLDAGQGREAVVDIAGIFRLEVRELDTRNVYLDLKQAQTLLDLPGGVTVIETTVGEIEVTRREEP